MLRKTLLILLSLFVIPAFAVTKERCTKQSLSNLVIAQWGGLWEQGKRSGFFRVLIYRVGWEHTHDVVQTEVMLRDEKRQRVSLLHCAQVKDDQSNPRIVKTVRVNEATRTKADVELVYNSAPFTSGEKILTYSVDINGKLSRKR
ncbi:MAG: hypothetical protein KDH94_07470 [Coxiellaceae bacterium]|nr:hypothetical protein [Coxiellaceae bacterium]